ncbi:MAG: MATE family efflux transporter [Anaerovoracaceae bacterium]|jgi:putative MATE family efflux protein
MTYKDNSKSEVITENKMGIMPVGRLVFTMSLPAMISMLIHALYNIVDSVFVAQLGEEALAAVTIVFPLQMFFISVAVGTGIGVNSLIARRLGARLYEEANQAAAHGMVLSLFNWFFFALMGIFLTVPFVGFFTDDSLTHLYGVQYCFVVLTFSTLPTFFAIMVEKIFQATGNMIYPMIISMVGAIINIILDPILIFGLLGAPRMEVLGAAIATVVGELASLSLAVFYLLLKEHDVKISLKKFRFQAAILKNIYQVGFPSIVMQSIGSVMLTGFNAILAGFSESALAVLGVYFRLQSFIFMPVFGINQGSMPIMGYNYGAQNKQRLMRTFKVSFSAALAIMALGLVIFQVFPEPLLRLFNASDEMMNIGVRALRIISLSFVPAAFGIVCSAFFQATGYGMFSLWVSLLRQMVIILPLAWILAKTHGVNHVWFSFPLSEIGDIIACVFFMLYIYRKDIINMKSPETS